MSTSLVCVVLVLLLSLVHPEITHADAVEVDGYVHDVAGNPVNGVFVEAYSLEPPSVRYGYASTDARGHYVLSLERPKRLDFPIGNPSTKGRPISEGYGLMVGWESKGSLRWVITFCIVETEGKNQAQQDFTLVPAGVIKLNAYRPDGSLVQGYPEGPYTLYTTDSHWSVTRSAFVSDQGLIALEIKTQHVINIPWNVPGFGTAVLRADDDGKGFAFSRQGEKRTINLNYELARTESRVLVESYDEYVKAGYVFSAGVSSAVHSAYDLFHEAQLIVDESAKAHLADLCLNQTLWTGEALELEKARQDIENYRKGNATIRIIDQNGKPIQGADMIIAQTSHDFLFGALGEIPLDVDAYELFKQAGMNGALLQLYWPETEPSPGKYEMENWNPVWKVNRLKEMGFRIGAEGLLVLEAGTYTWDTGLWNLPFEPLKARIHDHVAKLVGRYSKYVDYWIIHNPNILYNPLGFSEDQLMDLYKTAVDAVKEANPQARVLMKFDYPGSEGSWTNINDDSYTTDPYTFISRLHSYHVDYDGIAFAFIYGSLWELIGESAQKLLGSQVPQPFRDLGSISRILDWYSQLSEAIHVTEFNAPGNFTSSLGYWHRRSWDESLKTQWAEDFYTIAFSKPLVNEITYYNAIDQDYQTANRGLLDVHYAPRQSYDALKNLITEKWTTRLYMKTDSNGEARFRGFAGNYTTTIRTEYGLVNSTIHVSEQTSQSYTIKTGQPHTTTTSQSSTTTLGRAEAEQAIAKATDSINNAKTEGRTILLDRAEYLLQEAQKALSEENYGQATLLAGEADQAADTAVTWLVVPVAVVFAGLALALIATLYKRRKTARLGVHA